MAGCQGAQQGFAGKEERRTNLARFEDVAAAVFKSSVIPDTLLRETRLKANLLQLRQ